MHSGHQMHRSPSKLYEACCTVQKQAGCVYTEGGKSESCCALISEAQINGYPHEDLLGEGQVVKGSTNNLGNA